jgi:Predicted membrane protein
MEDPRHAQGPANNVLGIGQRILTTLVGIAETRVRLAVVELEEEKANLFQMLLMLGLTMLFAAFGLMSLMVLIIWAIDPQYRLNAMIATTVVLLVAALMAASGQCVKHAGPPSCATRARSWPTIVRCWRMTSRER